MPKKQAADKQRSASIFGVMLPAKLGAIEKKWQTKTSFNIEKMSCREREMHGVLCAKREMVLVMDHTELNANDFLLLGM